MASFCSWRRDGVVNIYRSVEGSSISRGRSRDSRLRSASKRPRACSRSNERLTSLHYSRRIWRTISRNIIFISDFISQRFEKLYFHRCARGSFLIRIRYIYIFFFAISSIAESKAESRCIIPAVHIVPSSRNSSSNTINSRDATRRETILKVQ